MSPLHLPRWFAFSPQEKAWCALLLGIFLVGLLARQLHGCARTPAAPGANPDQKPVEINGEYGMLGKVMDGVYQDADA